MISHRLECVFVAVPKTGTTSIKHVLHQNASLDIRSLPRLIKTKVSSFCRRRDRCYVHDNAAQIRVCMTGEKRQVRYDEFGFAGNPWEAGPLYETHAQWSKRRKQKTMSRKESVPGVSDWTRYYKFGFVRNPWDRATSLYERYAERSKRRKQKTISFEEFIEWMKYTSSSCIYSTPHRYQLDWFVDSSGDVLVDFIGKFERLDDDWATVAAKLKIDAPLPKLNVTATKHRHYTEYYNNKTRDIINTRFAVDIEYFEYEFGN